ncbi:MAG: hypothetical protein PWR01_3358 [Clostridiales bacterium]|jgi:hypothetical protein|nr:hypothetical protein [Clostridiales bacterium]MDN5282285.1 hypothetical protein [Candidatus Ozemobacter sp.]
MRSILRLIALLAIFSLCVVSAQAATYGYVSVKGKKLEMLRREVQTMEMLVKEWPNGEILAKLEYSSGLIFKKHEIVVVFAGNSKEITDFLTKAPYEGDFVKNVEVGYTFGNFVNAKGESIPGNYITTRKYPNIRKALEANLEKTSMDLWKWLYKKNNDYRSVEVVVTFYSMRINDDNRLFNLTGENGLVKSVPIDYPMVTDSN